MSKATPERHVKSIEFWDKIAKALNVPIENINHVEVTANREDFLRVNITFFVPLNFLETLTPSEDSD